MSHRTMLSAVAALVALLSVSVGGQAEPSGALSAELRAHVRDERFGIVTSIRGLPLGVRAGLQTLFGSQTLDIAEPGAEFRVTDTSVSPNLPSRRLVAAGCASRHCLVYYERGGIGHSWHVALFHWTPDATRFEWGGTAPGGLVTIDDVRRAILSGGSRAEVHAIRLICPAYIREWVIRERRLSEVAEMTGGGSHVTDKHKCGVKNVVLVHGGFVDGSGWQGVYDLSRKTATTSRSSRIRPFRWRMTLRSRNARWPRRTGRRFSSAIRTVAS